MKKDNTFVKIADYIIKLDTNNKVDYVYKVQEPEYKYTPSGQLTLGAAKMRIQRDKLDCILKEIM